MPGARRHCGRPWIACRELTAFRKLITCSGGLLETIGRKKFKIVFVFHLPTMVQICRELQANGTCSNSTCTFNHNLRICKDCDIICTSEHAYNSHLRGRKHGSKILGQSSPKNWNQHIPVGRDQPTTAFQGVSAKAQPERAGNVDVRHGQNYYSLRDRPTREYKHIGLGYLQGTTHQNKERFASYQTALQEAEKNKHGVTVTDCLDFGIVNVVDARARRSVNLQFIVETTTVPASRVNILDYKFSMSSGASSLYVAPVI